MKNDTTRNPELYQAISVLEARAYLLATGWKISEKYGNKGIVLSSPDNVSHLVLPLKETFADYSLRIAELISSVSKTEGRDALWIVKDMQLSGFDVFRVRLIENAKDGTIPLDSTEMIIEEAREMLVSSACACINPRKVYSSRKSKEVEDYMHKVRLGQTERGSYIFTLLSPVAPEISSTLPLPFDEPIIVADDPFDRKVTNMLSHALVSALDAANRTVETSNMSAFNEAVANGVSANFCEALSRITHESGSAEFSVSWANTRPNHTSNRLVTEGIKFTKQSADILEEAARQFKATEPKPDSLLKGYIFSLDKDKNDPLGNVQMKALIDDSLRTVKLALNEADYTKAIAAHKDYKTIAVEGELIQRGKFRTLEKIKNFIVDTD